MIRIRFDGPDRPEIISVEPDDDIEHVEWSQDGDDWILVIRFGKNQDRFGWTGNQVRITKK